MKNNVKNLEPFSSSCIPTERFTTLKNKIYFFQPEFVEKRENLMDFTFIDVTEDKENNRSDSLNLLFFLSIFAKFLKKVW